MDKLSGFVAGLGVAVGLAFSAATAQAQTLPQFSDSSHLGVQTCAGSTCHGAVQPWPNSSVLQNEAVTWAKHDPHAGAYDTLAGERAKRIAANLGIGDAQQAKICLDCHTNNVPQSKRAKNFVLSDGITCEACHGGAENWLGTHIAGVGGHADNLAAGMYPTDQPVARAKLCLSCHYGTKDKFVTHRIMGAGHPRLSFELDTYTFAQPAHFRVDSDYRQRKTWTNGVKTWAIGQAVAVQEILTALTDPGRNQDGIFPELVFFDCHACHHPMSNLRWQPRESVGLGPGIPRLNDGNLIMLRVVAGVIDTDLGAKIEAQTLALHQASTKGHEATLAAADELKRTMDGLIQKVSGHGFGGDQMERVLDALIGVGLEGEFVDYIAAEQATYAIGTVIAALEASGQLKGDALARANTALDGAYKAVENDESFKPSDYLAAIESVRSAVQ